MDLSANRHNPSHVADDFEDSSVEEEPYAYQYNEADQGDDDGNEDPHSQKRSIKKWTAEEVTGSFCMFFPIPLSGCVVRLPSRSSFN
jgi:hypothetical protein